MPVKLTSGRTSSCEPTAWKTRRPEACCRTKLLLSWSKKRQTFDVQGFFKIQAKTVIHFWLIILVAFMKTILATTIEGGRIVFWFTVQNCRTPWQGNAEAWSWSHCIHTQEGAKINSYVQHTFSFSYMMLAQKMVPITVSFPFN